MFRTIDQETQRDRSDPTGRDGFLLENGVPHPWNCSARDLDGRKFRPAVWKLLSLENAAVPGHPVPLNPVWKPCLEILRQEFERGGRRSPRLQSRCERNKDRTD